MGVKMLTKARIFFAQPIDCINRDFVVERVQETKKLLCDLPVELVAPYCDENWHNLPLDRKQAENFIEKDISAINTCDMLLVDLSREDRLAIGVIFEMAYFWFISKKKIIVYVGDSAVADRVWITATAQNICHTWENVRSIIADYTKS